jgi:iron complex outermembrane receptor protein
MKSLPSHRSTAAWKPLALVSALATLSFPAVAQVETGQKLTPVTVSASRFESTEAPIGATVITAEQIREAGVNNVNEAIRKIAGVYGRQNFSGTSDFTLDLNGFGTTSDNNIVVMVDGIRISENEQTPTLMSSIPIDTVERIEIVRSGSSVLFGDGATGGTIQIITKRGIANTTRGSVFAEVGSFGYQEARASISKGWDNFVLNANVGSIHADNYRANSGLRQDTFSGGLQWMVKDARLGFRIDSSRQDSRFPGSLTEAQYQSNPRQSFKPNEYGSFDVDRYTLFGEKKFGNLTLMADLSRQLKNTEFFQGALNKARTEMSQFSPRLRYVSSVGSLANEFVAGLDFTHWNKVGGWASTDSTQKSTAIYFRDEIKSGKARIAFGARHERFEKSAFDTVTLLNQYQNKAPVNAWSLEGAYQIQPLLNIFAKAGRSYRIANIDDNFGKSSNELLKPQTSDDLELGVSFGNSDQKLTARVFQHKLKNELLYDPTIFSNVNLDPTKRTGIEIEGRTRLTEAFTLTGVLQHIEAKFTEGPYTGREMVLVPKNTATLRLNWLPGNEHSADAGVQWVDKQRYGDDFSNACTVKMPSFVTLDARYAVRVGAWELAVRGTNLTDKNYFTNAFGACGGGIYPDPGRAVRFSARMDF